MSKSDETRPRTIATLLESLPANTEVGRPTAGPSREDMEAEIGRLRRSLAEQRDLIDRQNFDLNTLRSKLAALSVRLGAR